MLSGHGLAAFLGSSLGLRTAPVVAAAAPGNPVVGSTATSNVGPTVTQPISVTGNGTITGKTASLSVLAQDAAGSLTYTWSVSTASGGGSVTFSVNGKTNAQTTTATFTKAGTYTFYVTIADASGHSVTTNKTSPSAQTVSAIRNAPTTAVNCSGTSLQPFIPTFVNQFGNVFSTAPAADVVNVLVAAGPSGTTFKTSGGVTTVTFGMAGNYMFTAYVTGQSARRS